MLLQWLKLGPPLLHTSCYALATLAGGLLVFPAAFKALQKARLDMNVLMTVAVTGAWLVGEGAEGAAVVFLFALSELLESWSVGRARRAIAAPLPVLRRRIHAAVAVPIRGLGHGRYFSIILAFSACCISADSF